MISPVGSYWPDGFLLNLIGLWLPSCLALYWVLLGPLLVNGLAIGRQMVSPCRLWVAFIGSDLWLYWHWLAIICPDFPWPWMALMVLDWPWLDLLGLGWPWLYLFGSNWHWKALVQSGWPVSHSSNLLLLTVPQNCLWLAKKVTWLSSSVLLDSPLLAPNGPALVSCIGFD